MNSSGLLLCSGLNRIIPQVVRHDDVIWSEIWWSAVVDENVEVQIQSTSTTSWSRSLANSLKPKRKQKSQKKYEDGTQGRADSSSHSRSVGSSQSPRKSSKSKMTRVWGPAWMQLRKVSRSKCSDVRDVVQEEGDDVTAADLKADRDTQRTVSPNSTTASVLGTEPPNTSAGTSARGTPSPFGGLQFASFRKMATEDDIAPLPGEMGTSPQLAEETRKDVVADSKRGSSTDEKSDDQEQITLRERVQKQEQELFLKQEQERLLKQEQEQLEKEEEELQLQLAQKQEQLQKQKEEQVRQLTEKRTIEELQEQEKPKKEEDNKCNKEQQQDVQQEREQLQEEQEQPQPEQPSDAKEAVLEGKRGSDTRSIPSILENEEIAEVAMGHTISETLEILDQSPAVLRTSLQHHEDFAKNESDSFQVAGFVKEKPPGALYAETPSYVSFEVVEEAIFRNYFVIHDTSRDGVLDVQELMEVFDDMGRLPAKGSLDYQQLEALMTHATRDTNGELGYDGFVELMAAYYFSVYRRIFSSASVGSFAEIARLSDMVKDLEEVGFKVAPSDQDEFLKTNKLVMAHAEKFEFNDFCELMAEHRHLEAEFLQKQAGLDKGRVDALQHLFHLYDEDGGGSLDIREVSTLFQKAFKPIEDIDLFVLTFANMDVDHSASLDFEEFIRLVWVYNKIISKQKETDKQDGSPKVGDNLRCKRKTEDLVKLLEADKPENLGMAEEISQLTLANTVEDGVLARHWNVTVQEITLLRDCFEFCDADGSGVIEANEVKFLLQNIGFPPNTCMQQSVLENVLEEEFDSKGLNFHGTMELIMKYQTTLAQTVVTSYSNPEEGGIARDQMVLALYQVGQYLTKRQVDDLLAELGVDETIETIDVGIFLKLLQTHQSETLQNWRRSSGFPPEDIERFHEVYKKTGDDGIMLKNIMPVVTRLGFATESEKDVIFALMRTDRLSSGRINSFQDFVLLLRHLENRQLQLAKEKEDAVVSQSGLDNNSLQLFRDVFSNSAQGRPPKVAEQELKNLLVNRFKVVKSQQQRKNLNAAIQDVAGADAEDPRFSFAQFLQILHKLESA